MSSATDWSWAFYTIATLLAGAGLWLLSRALLSDRSRGKCRCPKCWYDMTGLVVIDEAGAPARESASVNATLRPCPECGHITRKPKHLSRTRRHWRVALLGVLVLLLSVAAAFTPKLQRDGWASLIPLRAFPVLRKVLTKEQFANIEPLYFKALSLLNSHDAIESVKRDPEVLGVRTRWPENARAWLPRTASAGPVTMIFQGVEMDSIPRSFSDSFNQVWNDGNYRTSPAVHSVQLGLLNPPPQPPTYGELPLVFVGDIDDYLMPIQGEDLPQKWMNDLRPTLLRRLPGSAPFYHDYVIAVGDVTTPQMQGVTLGLRVEFYEYSIPIASARWWQCAERRPIAGQIIEITGDLSPALADPTNPRFTVRFTGDGEMALRDFDATKYWKGSFTIPFADLLPKR